MRGQVDPRCCAQAGVAGPLVYLGLFAEKVVAYRAYDFAAEQLHGAKAGFHLPEETQRNGDMLDATARKRVESLARSNPPPQLAGAASCFPASAQHLHCLWHAAESLLRQA